MKHLFLPLLVFLINLQISVSQISLVKDINNITIPNPSNVKQFTLMSNWEYFVASSSFYGDELWRSNGTLVEMIKDIYPGPTGSNIKLQLVVNNTLFFAATSATSGYELWKTDGTLAGTSIVKDIRQGSGSSLSASDKMLSLKNMLLFRANDVTNGDELWKSDGTTVGTVMVKDIKPGSSGSSIEMLYATSNFIYFKASDGTNGTELWRSDGTDAGTKMIKNIAPGSYSSYISNALLVDTLLFFIADNDTSGVELWISDGTVSGTKMAKDIYPGVGSSNPAKFAIVDTLLFYIATDNTTGTELWKTNVKTRNTKIVKDIQIGTSSALDRNYDYLYPLKDKLVFSAYEPVNGAELWITDGSSAGTQLIKNIAPGSGDIDINGYYVVLKDKLYLRLGESSSNIELWVTDGTSSGTMLVKDIHPTSSSAPSKFIATDSIFYFYATSNTSGTELWRSNGTSSGTYLVKDIKSGTGSSSIGEIAILNNSLLFSADNGITGNELWYSDGTTGNTNLLKNINSDANSSEPFRLTDVNNKLFFAATTGSQNTELYVVENNNATLVKDINSGVYPGIDPLFYTNFKALNGKLYFAANDGSNGTELWRSDGTQAGTIMVKNINVGSSSNPKNLQVYKNDLYFQATGSEGSELWRADASDTNAFIVKDITFDSDNNNPRNLTVVNDKLFFVGQFGSSGSSYLYKTNGTYDGTSIVKDIYPLGDAYPLYLTFFDSLILFTAQENFYGQELWKSNGTEAGTVLVKDIYPGTTASEPVHLTKAGNKVFFAANDGVHGYELWVSDGTTNGTTLVKDILSGASSSINNLENSFFSYNNQLYFVANDSINGAELWKSDGTEIGTVMVKNIALSTVSSNPSTFCVFNNLLFFNANDGTGHALWQTDGTTIGTTMVSSSYYPMIISQMAVSNKILYLSALDDQYGHEIWKYDCFVRIDNQPKNDSVCLNSKARFKVNASGLGLTYQWQHKSSNVGAIWTNINGETKDSLLITDATLALNGYKYRCIVSSSCSMIEISDSVKLVIRILSKPIITQTGNVYKCITTGTATIKTLAKYKNYLWSNSAVDTAIKIHTPGNYLLTVTNTFGCTAVSDTFKISGLNELSPSICLITKETNSLNYLVVWETIIKQKTAHYILYKQGSSINDWNVVDTIKYGDTTVVEDINSQFRYQEAYRLQAVDSCGFAEPIDSLAIYKTLFISFVGNSGGVNMNITPYSINNTPVVFDSYIILRSTDSINFNAIDTIPGDRTVFLDNSPEAKANNKRFYYRLSGVKSGSPCNPLLNLKASTGPFSQSVSNLEDNRIKETNVDMVIKDSDIFIKPNPFVNSLEIEIVNPELQNCLIQLLTVDGKIIYHNKIKNENIILIDTKSYSSGTYFLKIQTNDAINVWKLVK